MYCLAGLSWLYGLHARVCFAEARGWVEQGAVNPLMFTCTLRPVNRLDAALDVPLEEITCRSIQSKLV